MRSECDLSKWWARLNPYAAKLNSEKADGRLNGPSIQMNRHQAIFQLDELASHVKDLVDEIAAGRYDEDGDLSYIVALSHLMDHLALAWHFSRMTDDELQNLTQEQFELLTNAIPKLNIENRLVELHEKLI